MAKKNEKPAGGKIEVKRRAPGKVNQNFFGEFKERAALREVHPLDEMFPDSPSTSMPTVGDFGRPQDNNLDAQILQTGRPKIKTLDVRTNITGRPQVKKLDVKTPKQEKPTEFLDAQTPKNKKLDAQKSKNWVKYEEHRSTDRLALRPSVEILQKAKVYAAENGLNLTELFELAVMNLIDLDAQNSKKLGVLTPLDDRRRRLLYKTDFRIVNLWLEYNRILDEKSKWKPKDDAIGINYNDVDIRIIEIGIIQTHHNYFQIENPVDPPRSFKYYTPEIEKVRAFPPPSEVLSQMLERHRKWWQENTGKTINFSFIDKE